MSDSEKPIAQELGEAGVIGGIVGGLAGSTLGVISALVYRHGRKLSQEQQNKVVDGVIDKVLPTSKKK